MRTAIIVVVLFFASCVTCQIYASGMGPMDYERLSDNGEYKVKVTAPNKEKQTKSQIAVFAKHGKKWRQTWTVTAVNSVEPASAYINNNGSCVITIGNWQEGRGDGSDELVVYKEGKVLNQYSPDGLLGGRFKPKYISKGGPAPWLSYSYSFFDQKQHFCLWVDVARKWVLIDLQEGALVKADQETELNCEEQARKDAYANIENKNGERCYADYRRLARFLHAEDKPIFEKLLMRPDKLGCSYLIVRDTQKGSTSFRHYSNFNSYRELAAIVLDALEKGQKDAIRDRDIDEHRYEDCRHLGSLSISATFERTPRKDDGAVVLWLEPINNRVDSTMKDRPAHAMGIDFFNKPHKSTLLKMPVRMIVYSILPGKYRIHGYWAKDIKYVYKIKEDFWKRTGGFVITNSPVVEIYKGRCTSGIALSFKKKKTP